MIEELLSHARTHAATTGGTDLPGKPARGVTVVTCMDARIDPARILGVEPGDIHVLRNAGGVITPDVRRSLTVSQRALGTREVMVIWHTSCGMLGLDESFASDLATETGTAPDWQVHGIGDLEADLAAALRQLRADPHLRHTDAIRGFRYDLRTAELTEVTG